MLTRRARISGRKWTAYETVGLGISVGKAAHEGEDFAATIEMVAALGKPCIIRLSDTLQRHNLMAEGMDAGEAWKTARERGDAWLQRNAGALEKLPSAPVVVRWDDVMNDPDFESVLAEFVRLSRHDSVFSETISNDVDRFLKRRTFLSSEERALSAQCSRDFLLEEVAGQTILGRRYSYAGFYPGSFAKILTIVRDQQIEGAPKGLENTGLITFSIDSRRQTYAPTPLLLAASARL